MIAPLGAPSLAEAVRAGAEVYRQLRWSSGGPQVLRPGWVTRAASLPTSPVPEEVLDAAGRPRSTTAGYTPGPAGVAIALDPAASEFHRDGRYHVGGDRFSSDDLIDRYTQMVEQFPIWSIEDGIGETDTAGWQRLTERSASGCSWLVTTTSSPTLRFIASQCAPGSATPRSIKVNQVGTVSRNP